MRKKILGAAQPLVAPPWIEGSESSPRIKEESQCLRQYKKYAHVVDLGIA